MILSEGESVIGGGNTDLGESEPNAKVKFDENIKSKQAQYCTIKS